MYLAMADKAGFFLDLHTSRMGLQKVRDLEHMNGKQNDIRHALIALNMKGFRLFNFQLFN